MLQVYTILVTYATAAYLNLVVILVLGHVSMSLNLLGTGVPSVTGVHHPGDICYSGLYQPGRHPSAWPCEYTVLSICLSTCSLPLLQWPVSTWSSS